MLRDAVALGAQNNVQSKFQLENKGILVHTCKVIFPVGKNLSARTRGRQVDQYVHNTITANCL